MRSTLLRLGLAAAIFTAAVPDFAGAGVIRGGLADGATAFDDTVLTQFGWMVGEIWRGLPETGVASARTFEHTITRTNGSLVQLRNYAIVGAPPDTLASGQMAYLDPPNTTDVATARLNSGVTIVSDRPMLAFGFEVGDWGTCCQPSRLYMALDDGPPIVLAETLVPGDQFLTAGGAALFVGLVGDGTYFSKVEFWHDGAVDFVAVGGAMRYVPAPDLPPPVPAPEPASAALLGAALVGAFVGRNKSARRRWPSDR